MKDMSSTPILLFALILSESCINRAEGVQKSFFLPYGNSVGDDNFVNSSSKNSAIPFNPKLKYGEQHFNKVKMDLNGDLDFYADGPFASIDVMCCKLRTESGTPWARMSTDPADLRKVEQLARKYVEFGPTFTPAWVLVATWDDVGTKFGDTNGNTMQAILATDGTKSLTLFDYVSFTKKAFDEIEFEPSGIDTFNIIDYYSLTDTNLLNSSNINVPGRFLFRIDETEIQLPTLITDVCTGVSVEGKQCPCKPNEFFSLSQERCVSECPICGYVSNYADYQGVLWEGPDFPRIVKSDFSDFQTARSDCEAQCSKDPFCAAFSLMDKGTKITCALLHDFFRANEFAYKQANVSFFHKNCK